MSKRDEYIAQIKLQLDELNASLNEMDIKAHEAKEEARAKYEEGMSKLRLQSQLAIDKLNELKAAGDSSWDKLVAETEKIRDALVKSYHYFKSQV